MLTGAWDNFDHLEDNLSYPELVAMVKAMRDREDRRNRMMAAVQGIELGKKEENKEDPVAAAKRRVAARQAGISEDQQKAKDDLRELSEMFAVVSN